MKFYATILISLLSLAAHAGVSFTMNYANNQSSTLTSPTLTVATNLTVFTYLGFPVTNGTGSQVVASGITNNPDAPDFQPIQVAFDLTGTNCEFVVSDVPHPADSGFKIAYWTALDGNTSTSYQSNSLGNGPNSLAYIPINFTTNGLHHVIFSVHGNFVGVNTIAGNTLAATSFATNKPNLLIVEGDSYTEGYSPATDALVNGTWSAYHFSGWVWQLAKLVPNTIAVESGIGGTGFIATSGGTKPTYVNRVVSDICTLYTNAVNSGLYNNIFISASGTINDDGSDTNAYFLAVTNVYKIIQAACPLAKVFTVGNWYANFGNISANQTAGDSVFLRSTNFTGTPYFSPVQAHLLDGIGGGNYSLFMSQDSAHPTLYGYGVMATNVSAFLGTNYGAAWTNNVATNSSSPTVNYPTFVNLTQKNPIYK